jgi:midasin
MQDGTPGDAMDVDKEDLGTAAAAAAAATAAQAKSAAAASLLKGQLLQDVVSLHQQLFSTLALHSLQHKLSTAAAAAADNNCVTDACSSHQQQQQQEAAVEEAFKLCFALGRQLVAAQQGLLPAAVDAAVRPGCIMALALEHRALNTAASSTAAAAVAAAAAASRRSGPLTTSLLTSSSSSSSQAVEAQLDMQQPFPEEAALMQAPLSALSQRLHVLLEEWPEHPLLQQLLGIVDRLLGLPLTTPLKAALTGLELLLARAQVWEETAARHVTLTQQLAAVAGLATRWRKLELASWKGLLERVQLRHAAGANSSWYHLYQLLLLGQVDPEPGSTAEGTTAGGSTAAVEGAGNDGSYRRIASLVEAFMQTSTVGEFAARLQLLYSFACQLSVTAPSSSSSSSSSEGSDQQRLCNMLWNVLSYYGQYLPNVSLAVEAGLGPLRKELSDFVKLAKWEDRGYYAMKISTEKAQRQLHRLSRRAEDVLKQPAAGVLAAASQGMGLAQVTAPKAARAAAAAAAKAATKAAKKQAAAAAAAAAAGDAGSDAAAAAAGQGSAVPAQGADIAAAAAAAAEVDPAFLGELESDAAAAAAAGDDPGAVVPWSASLDSLAAAAVAAGLGGTFFTAAAGAGGTAGTKQKLKGSRARKAAAAAAAAQFNSATAILADALEVVMPLEQQTWASFAAAVLATAAASSAHSTGSSSSYLARLPKLVSKMARVLGPPAAPAAATAPAATAAGGLPNGIHHLDDGSSAAVAAAPAVQLDDLAATAASRALQLSADISKGARLRKKKALNDLLHALAATGFSKRASDVPADDRDAAAWFSHTQPCLTGSALLQPLHPSAGAVSGSGSAAAGATAAAAAGGAVPAELLLLSASAWSKADRYYFSSLARLQRLTAAAKAPHKDLVLQEVTAAVGYVQHQMFLMRSQRALLAQLSDTYTQLLQATSTLHSIAAAGQYACSAAATGGSDGCGSNASVMPLPPQDWARRWLLSMQELLCGVTYQLAGFKQLLAAVAPMQQASNLPVYITSSCSSAVTHLQGWTAALQQHKAAVQSAAAALDLGACPVVGHGAVAALAAAAAAVAEVRADAAAATAAMAAATAAAGAADGGDDAAGVVCGMLPAWDRVLQVLQDAAQQADAFTCQHQQQQQQVVQLANQQAGAAAAAAAAAAAVDDQWSACVSQLVSQVLVVAQVLHGNSSNSSSNPAQQQGAGDATMLAAEAAEHAADAAEPSVDITAVSQATAEALKPARLAGIAATARQLLTHLAAASSSGSSDTAAAAAMVSQVSAVLPLLQLLLGGIQRGGCELLVLHKSLGKLSYICSSIFCTLVAQGYCVPEGEGAEGGEGGEGEMQWQEAGGTGMGEGTGKKDVSDQLTDEDQLLGAQQKDQQQQQQQEEQGQGEDESAQGVEMEADFDGSLHDIDDRKQQQGEGDSEEEAEGDDDRIQQQMGEVRAGLWGRVCVESDTTEAQPA